MPWYVLYVKSRSERQIAEKLSDLGIEVFCPLIEKKREWSDRIKIFKEPLFQSYCFVNLEERQRNNVFAVSGIIKYVFFDKKPAIIRDSEIIAVKWLLSEIDNDLIRTVKFERSQKVKVTSGHFVNSEGRILYQQGSYITMIIDSLQLIIKVNSAKNIIRPINS